MEINFGMYLSEQERKEIVADVFRQHCLETVKKDHERIFSNAGYQTVFKIVNENFDGKAAEMVAENAIRVIKNLSEHTVFRRKDVWEKEESFGYKALCEAVMANKDLLRERIKEIIESMDKDEVRDTLIQEAQNLLAERLFGKAA